MVNTHIFCAAIGELNFNIATPHYGLFQLSSLVAFRGVGIEIVFPFKGGLLTNLRVNRETKHHCVMHSLLVEHRQGAGHGQINGTGLGIGLGTKVGAGAGENFGFGGQLHMHLEADNGFPT